MKKFITLLEDNKQVDEYLINAVTDTSKELFFVKNDLQMTRGKDVTRISITVYKNFEIDGKSYKGSSRIDKLTTQMTDDEINLKIEKAVLAASFVKNEYYDLVDSSVTEGPEIKSAFNDGEMIEHISNLVVDLFSEDNDELAHINSCEFFIHKRDYHLINSKGVNIKQRLYYGEIELVTEGKNETEEVELFDVLHFSDYNPQWIKETVREALFKTRLRIKATKLPKLENIPVILTGEAVKEFFSYYRSKCSGSLKYQKINTSQIGESVHVDGVIGDKVSVTLVPYLNNSTNSSYFDQDGFFLQETKVIDNGILLRYDANKRMADYLNIEPTGLIRNTIVKEGNTGVAELKKAPYLELLSFSDFQMDPLTGNFGGEIRLGIYNDGTQEYPVTLGSISSTIKLVEKDMLFSKETQQSNDFKGPKLIKLNGVSIAGN